MGPILGNVIMSNDSDFSTHFYHFHTLSALASCFSFAFPPPLCPRWFLVLSLKCHIDVSSLFTVPHPPHSEHHGCVYPSVLETFPQPYTVKCRNIDSGTARHVSFPFPSDTDPPIVGNWTSGTQWFQLGGNRSDLTAEGTRWSLGILAEWKFYLKRSWLHTPAPKPGNARGSCIPGFTRKASCQLLAEAAAWGKRLHATSFYRSRWDMSEQWLALLPSGVASRRRPPGSVEQLTAQESVSRLWMVGEGEDT